MHCIALHCVELCAFMGLIPGPAFLSVGTNCMEQECGNLWVLDLRSIFYRFGSALHVAFVFSLASPPIRGVAKNRIASSYVHGLRAVRVSTAAGPRNTSSSSSSLPSSGVLGLSTTTTLVYVFDLQKVSCCLLPSLFPLRLLSPCGFRAVPSTLPFSRIKMSLNASIVPSTISVIFSASSKACSVFVLVPSEKAGRV